jgi:O-antigen ligase
MSISKLIQLNSKLWDFSEGIFCILFLISTFIIPISPKISIKVIIFSLFIALILNRSKFSFRNFISRSWDILLYILILIAGLLWTSDLGVGLRVLETSFSLLAIPVIFGFVTPHKDRFSYRVSQFFIYGTLTASVICLVAALWKFSEVGNLEYFFYYELTASINSHPTYHAYYVIFAITMLLYQLNEGKIARVWVTVLSVVFLFFVLILTSGRTAYAGLLLVFSFFILKSLLEPITSFRWIAVGLIGVMIVLLVALFFGNYFSHVGDYWERLELWRSALKANTSPLFGVGTGDYKSVLNEFYRNAGLEKFAQDSYNSHNQFIQVYFVHGLVGLGSFFILLIRPIYISVIRRKVLGTLLFFPFIIYGLNEVFLDRYQGVVFFLLVHQLIAFDYTNHQQWLQGEQKYSMRV